jgi:tetratricopeptide (TPR) repeat protein
LGDYEQAIRDCDKAVELEPESADIYHNRGYVYYQAGRYPEAIRDLERSLELDPGAADRGQVEELIGRLRTLE